MELRHGDLLHAAADHSLVQSTSTSLAVDGYCGRRDVPPRVSDQHSRTTWRGLRTLHQLSACRPLEKVSQLCSSGLKRNATGQSLREQGLTGGTQLFVTTMDSRPYVSCRTARRCGRCPIARLVASVARLRIYLSNPGQTHPCQIHVAHRTETREQCLCAVSTKCVRTQRCRILMRGRLTSDMLENVFRRSHQLGALSNWTPCEREGVSRANGSRTSRDQLTTRCRLPGQYTRLCEWFLMFRYG